MTAKIMHIDTKVCAACKAEKTADSFTRRSREGINRQSMCKDCHNAYVRSRYLGNHAQKRKENRLKKVYDLTQDQHDEMYASQNGCCKICRAHQSDLKHKLQVDHCHRSGRVRGLLCFNCNRGLGSFRDNASWLQEAIAYLEDNNGPQ